MSVWKNFKEMSKVRIELKELNETLEGYWIDMVPVSTFPPGVALAFDENVEGNEDVQLIEMIEKTVIDWRLPDDKNGLIPKPDGVNREWFDIVPMVVFTFAMEKANDEMSANIPKVSENQ